MRPTLLYIGRMLKRFFTCHPERSEGSHVFEKAGFFAALRMTLKVKKFMTHYTSIANPSCQRFGLNWRKLCATIGIPVGLDLGRRRHQKTTLVLNRSAILTGARQKLSAEARCATAWSLKAAWEHCCNVELVIRKIFKIKTQFTLTLDTRSAKANP
jgi:hypothetical protein